MSLNGSLVTPGYMGRGYDHYGRCVWTISVPKDHNIQLSMNISIENTYMCRSDFLRVREMIKPIVRTKHKETVVLFIIARF
jgi:hypothetical protein